MYGPTKILSNEVQSHSRGSDDFKALLAQIQKSEATLADRRKALEKAERDAKIKGGISTEEPNKVPAEVPGVEVEAQVVQAGNQAGGPRDEQAQKTNATTPTSPRMNWSAARLISAILPLPRGNAADLNSTLSPGI